MHRQLGLLLALVSALAPAALGRTAVAGYSADQIANAQAIINTATAMHLGPQAAALGVTAALGESDLRNLDYGDDAINPDGTVADSIGLFQQQHWWGSTTERMDPTTAAEAFYRHLEEVPEWQDITPTAAIHAVQGNADPEFYTPYFRPAVLLVRALGASMSISAPLPTLAPSARPGRAAAAVPAPSWTFSDVEAQIQQNYLDRISASP